MTTTRTDAGRPRRAKARFPGVVRSVTHMSLWCAASAAAKSRSGIMWPFAMKGKTTTWSRPAGALSTPAVACEGHSRAHNLKGHLQVVFGGFESSTMPHGTLWVFGLAVELCSGLHLWASHYASLEAVS
ncbi:hypothetical protein GUJ93_ZPchr0004g38132 [Zizania palustris]|uniref:Uncharacterized protein n=1 Tax=Zizania palustris TaxID=103762 RepID=A0A8J5RYC5_ZIZPA|nr:hypothetical protein GUJ93_ZPchr0004g38132 [Zizania palustris]